MAPNFAGAKQVRPIELEQPDLPAVRRAFLTGRPDFGWK